MFEKLLIHLLGMCQFIVTQVRSDIKVSDSVIFGTIEKVKKFSRARKSVPGNYIHNRVYNYLTHQYFHIIHHEDCCAEKIAQHLSIDQSHDLHDENMFFRKRLFIISPSDGQDNYSIWFVSGDTRINLIQDFIEADCYGFVLENSQKQGFAWSIGDECVNILKDESNIPSCFRKG